MSHFTILPPESLFDGGCSQLPPHCCFPQLISPATFVPMRLAFSFLSALTCPSQSPAGRYGWVCPREAQGDEAVGDSKGGQLLFASHPTAPNLGQGCATSCDSSVCCVFVRVCVCAALQVPFWKPVIKQRPHHSRGSLMLWDCRGPSMATVPPRELHGRVAGAWLCAPCAVLDPITQLSKRASEMGVETGKGSAMAREHPPPLAAPALGSPSQRLLPQHLSEPRAP